jgi:hypothetical protein
MDRNKMKTEVEPQIKVLEDLQKQVASVLTNVKLTVAQGSATGTNTCAIESIMALSSNPLCPTTLKPVLNRMHKALWKNAEYNMLEQTRAQREELALSMPAQFRSKRKAAPIDTGEVTNPEALLNG